MADDKSTVPAVLLSNHVYELHHSHRDVTKPLGQYELVDKSIGKSVVFDLDQTLELKGQDGAAPPKNVTLQMNDITDKDPKPRLLVNTDIAIDSARPNLEMVAGSKHTPTVQMSLAALTGMEIGNDSKPSENQQQTSNPTRPIPSQQPARGARGRGVRGRGLQQQPEQPAPEAGGKLQDITYTFSFPTDRIRKNGDNIEMDFYTIAGSPSAPPKKLSTIVVAPGTKVDFKSGNGEFTLDGNLSVEENSEKLAKLDKAMQVITEDVIKSKDIHPDVNNIAKTWRGLGLPGVVRVLGTGGTKFIMAEENNHPVVPVKNQAAQPAQPHPGEAPAAPNASDPKSVASYAAGAIETIQGPQAARGAPPETGGRPGFIGQHPVVRNHLAATKKAAEEMVVDGKIVPERMQAFHDAIYAAIQQTDVIYNAKNTAAGQKEIADELFKRLKDIKSKVDAAPGMKDTKSKEHPELPEHVLHKAAAAAVHPGLRNQLVYTHVLPDDKIFPKNTQGLAVDTSKKL